MFGGCLVEIRPITTEYVKLASGYAASLVAEGFPMLSAIAAQCDAGSATLRFDGVNYGLAPRMLALPNIQSRAGGNDTLLILNRLGGDLRMVAASLGEISGALYDDMEQAFGFSSAAGRCQFISRLSNDFPRTTPQLDDLISAGHTGWMKLWLTDDAAMLGAAINLNSSRNTGAFNYGYNLRKLTLTRSASLTIPVFPPSC